MEFFLILFVIPILVTLFSFIGTLVFNKWFTMPLITLIALTILMFIVFNYTFIGWIFVFVFLSFVVSLITNLSSKIIKGFFKRIFGRKKESK